MAMRYTKQAMTLAQQILTLQGRGLMIADTNKAEQALDAISYFRLADYWYHLEADHHTHTHGGLLFHLITATD